MVDDNIGSEREPGRETAIREGRMKKFYDFSKGKRGAVVPLPPGKTRITIRFDNEIIDWFRDKVEARGGGSYQTMINNALRDYIRRGGEDFGVPVAQASSGRS